MTVGEMKKLIENIPDDVRFYAIVGDHEAQEQDFSDHFVTDMKLDTGRSYNGEFFGDADLLQGETKVRALVGGY